MMAWKVTWNNYFLFMIKSLNWYRVGTLHSLWMCHDAEKPLFHPSPLLTGDPFYSLISLSSGAFWKDQPIGQLVYTTTLCKCKPCVPQFCCFQFTISAKQCSLSTCAVLLSTIQTIQLSLGVQNFFIWMLYLFININGDNWFVSDLSLTQICCNFVHKLYCIIGSASVGLIPRNECAIVNCCSRSCLITFHKGHYVFLSTVV